jgi:hypothetical protein
MFALVGIGFDTERTEPFLEMVRGWLINMGMSYRGYRDTESINMTPIFSSFRVLSSWTILISGVLESNGALNTYLFTT